MIPVLFKIGPLALHTFGLMLVVAFFGGATLVVRELRRRGLTPDHLEGYPIVALLGGIVGARVYYLLTHFDQFVQSPFRSVFADAGLTWYGGLIGGALATLWLARRNHQPLWALCDAFGPGLAAAYGIGRIGCQLAGDGDYGPPSDLPWAMAYPKGAVPTTVAVHPTPVYEVLMMIPVVAILWRMRTLERGPGWMFGLYLVLVGIERWIAEIFRVRPVEQLTAGMSTAQWFSVVAIMAGLWLLGTRRRPQRGQA